MNRAILTFTLSLLTTGNASAATTTVEAESLALPTETTFADSNDRDFARFDGLRWENPLD